MKHIFINLLLIFFTFISLASSYSIKTHEVILSGTSNLHDWTAHIKNIIVDAELIITNGRIEQINKIIIEIDATSIIGSEGNIMTRKIRETLKANHNPRIIFNMSKIDNINQLDNKFTIVASGVLIIVGITHPLNLIVKGEILPNGDIQFNGIQETKMSTWKLEPPRAMLGALRTADDVIVNFSVTVGKQ